MIKVALQIVEPRSVAWIVDSGVLVSLFAARERLHQEAVAFSRRVSRRGEVIEIPEVVIDEVLHVLLAKPRWGERRTEKLVAYHAEAARRFLSWVFGGDRRTISVPRDLNRLDYWTEVAKIAGTRLRRKTVGGTDAAVIALVKDRPLARLCTTEGALLELCAGVHVSEAADA